MVGRASIQSEYPEYSAEMDITTVTFMSAAAFALALLLIFGRWGKVFGNLRKLFGSGAAVVPHEFAYGSTLPGSDAIAQRIDQFLSLLALDSHQTQTETFVRNTSASNLKPLIRYVSSLGSEFRKLAAALETADQLSDQKQKAVQAVKLLVPYKELLKNEAEQETIILFVNYALKQPFQLAATERTNISQLVRRLDTAEQSREFDSGQCPPAYLKGNINIYPLSLDNTGWRSVVQFDAPEGAPILEIRFMGLRGVFKYLLADMTAKTGVSFRHLDGNTL